MDRIKKDKKQGIRLIFIGVFFDLVAVIIASIMALNEKYITNIPLLVIVFLIELTGFFMFVTGVKKFILANRDIRTRKIIEEERLNDKTRT